MARTTFRAFPAFTDLDPTDASSIDRLLAFHRATFGDAQMRRNANDDGEEDDAEDENDGQGDDGADDGDDGDDGDDAPAKFVDSTGKTWDFPTNTRVKDMTPEEASEYWRHKAQKHEKENERLRRRPKTTRRSQDRSADDGGRDDSRNDDDGDDDVDAEQARQEERDAWAPRLVRSEMRRFLPSRLTEEQVEAIVAPLNTNHFLTSDGEVDTAKVKQYANSVSPGTTFPGTGQGRERGENSGRGSVASAREDYVESRRKKR